MRGEEGVLGVGQCCWRKSQRLPQTAFCLVWRTNFPRSVSGRYHKALLFVFFYSVCFSTQGERGGSKNVKQIYDRVMVVVVLTGCIICGCSI